MSEIEESNTKEEGKVFRYIWRKDEDRKKAFKEMKKNHYEIWKSNVGEDKESLWRSEKRLKFYPEGCYCVDGNIITYSRDPDCGKDLVGVIRIEVSDIK